MIMMVSLLVLGACSNEKNVKTDENAQFDGQLVYDYKMELKYAQNFSVDYYKGGYKLITISDGKKFLTVPENMSVPTSIGNDVTVLQMPIDNTLISSAPTVSLIHSIHGLSNIALTTTDKDSWYIDDVKNAMGAGSILYAGDYREPDYELLVATSPKLSVFSSMISTTPDVAEKLEELGLPYFIDGSTYEVNPMARVEWVKLYGALFDCEDAAESVFNTQLDYVNSITVESTGKSVAILYITSSGTLYARNGGDYLSKMVEMAGGKYVLAETNADKAGNQKMGMEDFYAEAKDADYIMYIWNIGGKPADIEALKGINPIFADFKAVQDGNVWCTTEDFFQVADTLGYMVKDFNTMLTDSSQTKLTYLFKLQ